MKSFKSLIIVLFLTQSIIGNSQWVEMNNIPLRSIQTLNFVDDNLGYALMLIEFTGTITLEKTSDGGHEWSPVTLPVLEGEFQDIHFYADGKGVILIRNLEDDIVPTRLYQTFDDGENWQDISPDKTGKGPGVGACQFLNKDVGFFATDKQLYITQDGGNEWTVKEFDNYILSLDFKDANHGSIGTWDGTYGYKGGILSTSDGGEKWNEIELGVNYTSIGKVQRLSENLVFAAPIHGWASIIANQLFKSTDGGISWKGLVLPTLTENATLRQEHFKDEMNGVICTGDHSTTSIYHTTNGGDTWEKKGTFESSYDTDMQLTTKSGYITGVEGAFFRLNDLTNTHDIISKNIEVKIFPSPAQSGQIINWNSTETFSTLKILNIVGKKIYQQKLLNNKISLPNLNSGLYLLQFLNDKTKVTRKLHIE